MTLRQDLVALLGEYRQSANPAPYTTERALVERIEGLLEEHPGEQYLTNSEIEDAFADHQASSPSYEAQDFYRTLLEHLDRKARQS